MTTLLYYEIADACIGRAVSASHKRLTHKYHVTKPYMHGADPMGPMAAMYSSERAWQEDETGVKFVKNRHGENMPVDMKEFFWVKLQAVNL
jgi:hypothetical protein